VLTPIEQPGPDEKAMKLAFEDNAIIPKKREELLEILRSNKSVKFIIRREYHRCYLLI
jgi:hypothetical protein